MGHWAYYMAGILAIGADKFMRKVYLKVMRESPEDFCALKGPLIADDEKSSLNLDEDSGSGVIIQKEETKDDC